jgi:sarcosine oxidase
MSHYDAVVVGLGAVGSFALRALSKTPGRWLGIERYSLGSHAHGSSYGKTRIYRRAYFEHPHYVPWIEFSLDVFRELQEYQRGSALMQECGMLLMAPKACSNHRPDNLPPLLAASLQAATEHDIPVEFLETASLKERFPQFCHKHDMVGLLEPGAGILRPERVIQAAQADALSSGYAAMRGHARVVDIQKRLDGKLVIRIVNCNDERSSQGSGRDKEEEIIANTVLISAGAWASQLIPQWAPYLTVTRQIQAWIDSKWRQLWVKC